MKLYGKKIHENTSADFPWLGRSQHIDTSKNTKAKLICCYVLHSYVGTIFSYDKLLKKQHPPSRNGDKSSKDGV